MAMDSTLPSPAVMEAGDELLHALHSIEDMKEIVVTTIEEDSDRTLPPVSAGSGTKPSQVRPEGC